MDLSAYREEIKFRLTGGVLALELPDTAIDQAINAALRELHRYINTTYLITLPYQPCIDMSKYNVNAVTKVFRAQGFTAAASESGYVPVDPMQASMWQLMAGTGNLYNFTNNLYNYLSWNTLLQVRNTTSTDLSFWFQQNTQKLLINVAENTPAGVTIEYIPRIDKVEDIVSDFWIDVLMRLALALVKVTVGRVRSKYKQTNALWTLDGETMLNEGNAELSDIREKLLAATQLCYPID